MVYGGEQNVGVGGRVALLSNRGVILLCGLFFIIGVNGGEGRVGVEGSEV